MPDRLESAVCCVTNWPDLVEKRPKSATDLRVSGDSARGRRGRRGASKSVKQVPSLSRACHHPSSDSCGVARSFSAHCADLRPENWLHERKSGKHENTPLIGIPCGWKPQGTCTTSRIDFLSLRIPALRMLAQLTTLKHHQAWLNFWRDRRDSEPVQK